MRVILLDNIKGVGQVGDVKQVSDGYARNFLFPRQLARAASPGAVKDIQALKQKRLTELTLAADNAKAMAEKLKDTVLEFGAKANQKGTLFEGITAEDIVTQLKKTTGASVPLEAVKLDEPIKSLGEHTITLELTPDLSIQIKAQVSAQ